MSQYKDLNGITGPGTGASPTKERARQHGGLVCEMVFDSSLGSTIKRYRAVYECPLDAYRAYGVISFAEYRVGLDFHQAYYGAVLGNRLDFNPIGLKQACREPTKIEKSLKAARGIIRPSDLSALIDVCGHCRPAVDERALASLKRGLGDLASVWRLAATEVCDLYR